MHVKIFCLLVATAILLVAVDVDGAGTASVTANKKGTGNIDEVSVVATRVENSSSLEGAAGKESTNPAAEEKRARSADEASAKHVAADSAGKALASAGRDGVTTRVWSWSDTNSAATTEAGINRSLDRTADGESTASTEAASERAGDADEASAKLVAADSAGKALASVGGDDVTTRVWTWSDTHSAATTGAGKNESLDRAADGESTASAAAASERAGGADEASAGRVAADSVGKALASSEGDGVTTRVWTLSETNSAATTGAGENISVDRAADGESTASAAAAGKRAGGAEKASDVHVSADNVDKASAAAEGYGTTDYVVHDIAGETGSDRAAAAGPEVYGYKDIYAPELIDYRPGETFELDAASAAAAAGTGAPPIAALSGGDGYGYGAVYGTELRDYRHGATAGPGAVSGAGESIDYVSIASERAGGADEVSSGHVASGSAGKALAAAEGYGANGFRHNIASETGSNAAFAAGSGVYGYKNIYVPGLIDYRPGATVVLGANSGAGESIASDFTANERAGGSDEDSAGHVSADNAGKALTAAEGYGANGYVHDIAGETGSDRASAAESGVYGYKYISAPGLIDYSPGATVELGAASAAAANGAGATLAVAARSGDDGYGYGDVYRTELRGYKSGTAVMPGEDPDAGSAGVNIIPSKAVRSGDDGYGYGAVYGTELRDYRSGATAGSDAASSSSAFRGDATPAVADRSGSDGYGYGNIYRTELRGYKSGTSIMPGAAPTAVYAGVNTFPATAAHFGGDEYRYGDVYGPEIRGYRPGLYVGLDHDNMGPRDLRKLLGSLMRRMLP